MQRPLVIAHVLATFDVAGAEMVAATLADEQIRRGHRVLMVGLAPPGSVRLRLNTEIDIHILPKREVPGVDLGLILRLARLFRREGVEVVHLHNVLSLIYGAPAARLSRRPAIYTKHGDRPDTHRRLVLRRLAGRLLDAFVAVSSATAETAQRTGEASGTIQVIENGVDGVRFHRDQTARHTLRSELGVSEEACLIGTVGRLETVKQHDLLIRAVAPLLSGRLYLAIAGDGPRRELLERLVDEVGGRGRIHLLGFQPDVPRILSALDIFVLSSATEGMPMVLLEAMACCLPVISTAVGGIPHVLQEHTGVLVPPGDEAALREQIRALAANPALAHRLGENGRERLLSQYATRTMCDRYLELYQQVVRG